MTFQEVPSWTGTSQLCEALSLGLLEKLCGVGGRKVAILSWESAHTWPLPRPRLRSRPAKTLLAHSLGRHLAPGPGSDWLRGWEALTLQSSSRSCSLPVDPFPCGIPSLTLWHPFPSLCTPAGQHILRLRTVRTVTTQTLTCTCLQACGHTRAPRKKTCAHTYTFAHTQTHAHLHGLEYKPKPKLRREIYIGIQTLRREISCTVIPQDSKSGAHCLDPAVYVCTAMNFKAQGPGAIFPD